jgi:UDP-4-amino-4,6-dideoxy-N-acetyl-beta-L-altrosamine N-acetyltransferase
MIVPTSVFRPIRRKDLELVRTWRNQERIRSNFIDASVISAEQQQRWFDGLRGDSSRQYMMYEQNGTPIGQLYFTNIDEHEVHLGYFVGIDAYWPGTGLLLEFAALDYASTALTSATMIADVLSNNTGPQRIHREFGIPQTKTWTSVQAPSATPITLVRFEMRREVWRERRASLLTRFPKRVAEAVQQIQFHSTEPSTHDA